MSVLRGRDPTGPSGFEDSAEYSFESFARANQRAGGAVGGRGGHVFPVNFTVHPHDGEATEGCQDVPAKRLTCETVQLTEAVEAGSRVFADGPRHDVHLDHLRFREQHRPDRRLTRRRERGSAPVTTRQLLYGVRETGLLDVVRYAGEHPVLEKQIGVRGG